MGNTIVKYVTSFFYTKPNVRVFLVYEISRSWFLRRRFDTYEDMVENYPEGLDYNPQEDLYVFVVPEDDSSEDDFSEEDEILVYVENTTTKEL